jgi:hypothetical protein
MGWVGLQKTKIFLMNVLTYSKLNNKTGLMPLFALAGSSGIKGHILPFFPVFLVNLGYIKTRYF